MPISAAKLAEMRDFEIAAARLYVQAQLSTSQIAERLRCERGRVEAVLRGLGLKPDSRPTWAF